MIDIKRALISVSDKNGIIQFAQKLSDLGVEILSTGGTSSYLKTHGIKVTEVSDITNFPEILDGRVKTLHPKVHGAILAKAENIQHKEQLKEHEISKIDLVCVNLYPFELTISNPDCKLNDAIENIDIGGPAMIRAAAKNYQEVLVITDNNDYNLILEAIESNTINDILRLKLAQKAFNHTAYYDSIINNYLAKIISKEVIFAKEMTIPAKLVQELRYGENAHQRAAFYRDSGNIDGLLAGVEQLQGKELSYNNLVDSDTAWECVKQFTKPACVIVKHANPCAAAIATNAVSSYMKAFATNPKSSFGGIIAFNTEVDEIAAKEISQQFVEVLIAPAYSKEALNILNKKSNIRVLKIKLVSNYNSLEYKRIGGGLLVQTPENKNIDRLSFTTVTKNKATESMLNDLEFAWNIVKFVKSNAIVLVKEQATIGIGAGQTSRIDASNIAINKALEFGFDINGAVCASDAFFPFRDNIDLLAKHGVKAIIQPGGSIKDAKIFKVADEQNLVMVLSGYRVFKH